jgi:hypothetical protein
LRAVVRNVFQVDNHRKAANDNTREELCALVDQVSGMSRQIQRLQTGVREL